MRLATFNAENLFSRTRILNLEDSAETDRLLGIVGQIQKIINKETYTAADKERVLALSKEVRVYIDFRTDSGGLGDWNKDGYSIFKNTKGRGNWTGEVVFRRAEFSFEQRKNTGKVIKAMQADVLCGIEIEGMDVLRSFNSQVLQTQKHRYPQYVMIDSPNDPRGIDVACLSRFPIVNLRTHVFDNHPDFKPVFSRDCLEVTLDAGLDRPLHVLCNHFKSQSGKTKAEKDKSALKRKAQTETVLQIMAATYNLAKDYVVVLGDLNEDSSNSYQSLAKLFNTPNLHPVVDPNLPVEQRYTYFFEGGKVGQKLNQLDYIFLSKPLFKKVSGFGFERRGIFNIDQIAQAQNADAVTPFDTVVSFDTSASDHAGLWVDIDLP
jgi:endonuclease/exonuclease/phosphatase family metal-dependent hydrolase